MNSIIRFDGYMNFKFYSIFYSKIYHTLSKKVEIDLYCVVFCNFHLPSYILTPRGAFCTWITVVHILKSGIRKVASRRDILARGLVSTNNSLISLFHPFSEAHKSVENKTKYECKDNARFREKHNDIELSEICGMLRILCFNLNC